MKPKQTKQNGAKSSDRFLKNSSGTIRL